ncbi:MAG: hypothetical protein PHU95_04875 [Candidatus Thermoplasmatota archaeon]|nr:hypothetical protein [Candidatus Thermoplasmatota archaeon]
MEDGLLREVLSAIDTWKPRRAWKTKIGYRRDLVHHLTGLLVKDPAQLDIVIERGKSRCDIVVNGVIGIKVNKNVAYVMQVHRLGGQLAQFQRAYRHVIILTVGTTRGKAGALLREKIAAVSHRSASVTLVEKQWPPQKSAGA